MANGSKSKLAVGLAAAIDVGAGGLLIAGTFTAAEYWFALALHLVATACLLLTRGLPASRRSLMIALGFTIPIVGAAAAVLSLAKGGRSELEVGIGDEGPIETSLDARLIHDVGDALSLPEALLVADAEQRRAMLWGLGRRGDVEAIALLRWALTAVSAELGLEAALALEDVTISFEHRLDAHRRTLQEAPTHAAALAAADLITYGFETGVLDLALIPAFADEAHRHCALASELDRGAIAEVALARARFELAIQRPDIALDVLDRAFPAAAYPLRSDLSRLRDEAALRANDIPWEGPSALLTYRPPLPSLPSLPPSLHRPACHPGEAQQTA